METPRLLEDTLHPAARLASARALLAGTPRADRPEAIRRAEALALEEERRAAAVAAEEDLAEVGEDLAAAVAGIGNRFGRAQAQLMRNATIEDAWGPPELRSPRVVKVRNGEKPYAANKV
jgi:hypothetical protein